jgi:hypothetical protein
MSQATPRTTARVLLLLAMLGGQTWATASGQAGSVVAVPVAPVHEHATLRAAPGWPVWLKDYRTRQCADQTSGIAHAGRDADGSRLFFLADEVGFLHACRVWQPEDTGAVRVELESVRITPGFSEMLRKHEHWDFAALALVPQLAHPAVRVTVADTLTGLLSIEGRGVNFREQTDLVRLALVRRVDADERVEAGTNAAHWQVEARGPWIPGATFWQGHVGIDRGIAGIGIAPNFTFLGLASFVDRGEFNVRGTMIYLHDPRRDQIAQVITRRLEISSIGDLFALADTVLVAVDRDRQAIDVIRWDPALPGQVTACDRFPLELLAPGGYRYAVPSVAGLTIDEQGDLWCVTDPWLDQARVLEPAAPETLHVYVAAGIPMMYRFPGERVWKETGLSTLWEPSR